jgi:ABC-type transport system involved in multi-copper enzyme maturation permease subunit
MTQTLAIFVDAYRDLNAKKLFWVVLGLSALVVLVFFTVGIDERGISLLSFRLSAYPTTAVMDRGTFYTGVFLSLGVGVWLTWAASILALVSTAGVFPELIASGSVDLYLSRPIGRLRLFLTRYVAALTFAFLQVLVFSAGCFLLLGIRGGTWSPGVFLAVPVVLVFFSYLYAVCVLIGLLTKSGVAALLLTIVFWLVVFGLHFAEATLLLTKAESEVAAERLTKVVADREAKLAKFDAEGGEATQLARRGPKVDELEAAKRNLARARENVATSWQPALFAVKTVLPKTSETVALLERWLKSATEVRGPGRRFGTDEDAADKAPSDAPVASLFNPRSPDRAKAQERVHQVIEARSVGWVAGTSLAFEGVVLAAAAWVFCRRDY